MRIAFVLAAGLVPGCSCGGDDAAEPDANPNGVNTLHCTFEDVPATSHAGSAVTAGPLMAGAAEVPIDVPVGTGQGGYTARADFLGAVDAVDNREVAIAAAWLASVGIETRPMAKAVALRVGVETVVWIKVDAIFAYEDWVFDLERRLGDEFRGKVLISTSHSHSAFSQFTGHSPLKVGSGEFREVVHERFTDANEAAARAAIAALQPATIGIHSSVDFDPQDVVSHERRGENDELPGGNRKDDHLRLIRIDTTGGDPIAIIPIFGMHPVLNDADNSLASNDAVGGLERALAEQFDEPVVVMHVQSAGADVTASGAGDVDCDVARPGAPGDPCFQWLKAEGHGRRAVDVLMTAWTSAGGAMESEIELSMVTRSVELGPYAETYSLRGGALTYAPFDLEREPDMRVWTNGRGSEIISPIDEWNAPVGAALCENNSAMFPAAAMPGVEGIDVYGSCLRLDEAGAILGPILQLDISDVRRNQPACGTTRTTVSALRLGDYLVGTIPGELSVLLADKVRANSPVDVMHTIAVGYSQGHIGYCMTPEDWLHGGYEPSVTFGGPLEAELVAEKLAALMPDAMAPTRPDAAAGGANRVVIAVPDDNLPHDLPAPMAGMVPATVPSDLWMRAGRPDSPQPAITVPRVTGLATFVWLGDDPLTRTPVVTLQHDPGTGVWAAVTRRSGRFVQDGEIIVTYAPSPLIRTGSPQQHVWSVEWQPVPWVGAPDGDGMERVGSVTMGNYRFHIEGDGWTLDSQSFQVQTGELTVSASRTGNNVTVASNWHAPKGYRLLHMQLPSNVPVPLANQQIRLQAVAGAVPVGGLQTVTTDAQGRVTIDYGAAAATITRVDLVDAFDNPGSANL
jgi:neutral ceramidase